MMIASFIFHYLHIVATTFWVGSMLYTELVLWPQMRAIGQLDMVQGQLRQLKVRKFMAIFIVGTIVTGYFRALFGGAFDRLFSSYGQWFVVGALVGISMMVWWLSFPPRTMKTSWKAFYSAFWVVLFFMLAMRFAGPATS